MEVAHQCFTHLKNILMKYYLWTNSVGQSALRSWYSRKAVEKSTPRLEAGS
jgi:hypothetical protein